MKKKEIKRNNVYDYHDTFDEYDIAVVGKGGKFGYVGKNGETITPLKYDKAMRFYWDAGKVCIDGKWGLVDVSGVEITPLIYDEIKGHQDPIVALNGKYGYVSRETGELLTPVKYDCACEWTQSLKFVLKRDLAAVQLDGKWGCINLHGKEVVPLKYDKIKIYQGDNPCVSVCRDGKWGFIDSAGTVIAPCEYDSVNEFDCHRACVEKNGKFGFIDDAGIVVIPVIYDYCECRFNKKEYDKDCISPLAVAIDGKYGYIDTNGVEIVKPVYGNAFSFYSGNGMAAVTLNGKVGFIDETGKEVIPFIYEPDDTQHDWNDLNCYRFFDRFANVKLNGKWGVINMNNNVVIQFLYDEFLHNQYACWRYALRGGRKLGVDTKGNEYLMQKNPAARTFKDYLYAVTLTEVVESGVPLLGLSKKEAKNLRTNFNNFLSKTPRPSQNIIRIHSDYGMDEWEHPPIDVEMYNVEDECAYVFFDWNEILDMEVRIEDNLTLSDAGIVAAGIWSACNSCLMLTEDKIRKLFEKLDEQSKTDEENKT